MTRQSNSRKRINHPYQIIALGLIGVGLLVLGALALVLLPKQDSAASSKGSSGTGPAQVSYPAPALSLTDLQDERVSLENYLGQVVLVNNWATWCPPCKAEMPALQAFYEDHHHQDFTIVAIEAGDPPAEVAEFVATYDLTFPVWLDPAGAATDAFRNPALPSSYVIDKTGTVRLAWVGAVNLDALEKYVTPFLEE